MGCESITTCSMRLQDIELGIINFQIKEVN